MVEETTGSKDYLKIRNKYGEIELQVNFETQDHMEDNK